MELHPYLDFEVQIDAARDDGLHAARVIRSPAGEGDALIDLGGLPEEARSGAPPASLHQAREIGGALYTALFRDEVGALLAGSRQRALAHQSGLRIRLRIDSPEVAALPWELLFDEREDQFLALSQETPIVRYLPAGAPVEPLTVEPPLRILGIVSAPKNLPPVNVEAEKARLEESISRTGRSRRVEVVWLEGQTWRALQEAMLSGPWHIVHYLGHAQLNEETGAGELLLADDAGQSKALAADEFGSLLEDHASLRLVVLNACEGARSDEARPFGSIAAELVRSGLPAVVAMQYEITTAAAAELTRAFYAALAEGLPVDAALAVARAAIRLASQASVEWATPVLYLRSPDAALFAPVTTRARLRRLIMAAAGGVAVLVGLWALIYWVVLPWAFPTKMPGVFNVAVADIGTVDASGRVHKSELGDKLSLAIYEELAQEYASANASGLFSGKSVVWHDSLGRGTKNVAIGRMDGATDEERTYKAAALAERIGADMVVYGRLTDPDNGEDLTLEFYHASPIKAGEPSPVAGNLTFGSPIENPVPYAANKEGALDNLFGPAELRTDMFFYLTRAIVLGSNNKYEEALTVLDDELARVSRLPAGSQAGIELLQLYRGIAALAMRDYDTALAAIDDALARDPDYVNALMLKGNVYTDRSQLYYVKDRPLSTEEQACIQSSDFSQAPADQAAALADAQEGVTWLARAAELAPRSSWTQAADYVALNQGIAYRALGQAQIFGQDYAGAGASLDRAADLFTGVLARFSGAQKPQYEGWAEAGLGSTRRLQAYLSTVDAFFAQQAKDAEGEVAANAAAMQKLGDAITAFDACLALDATTAGNQVFHKNVLECSCVPYAVEARAAQATLSAATAAVTDSISSNESGVP